MVLKRNTDSLPEALEPYVAHGVELNVRGEEAIGDCPFCGREGKFSVNTETGKWRCFVCAAGSDRGGGNALVFLKLLWEEGVGNTADSDLEKLRANRSLLSIDTLKRWGVARSPLTGEWLIPALTLSEKVMNLYRYTEFKGQMSVMSTTGIEHFPFGAHLTDPKRPEVWLCEGPWDAMALWEVMVQSRWDDGDSSKLCYTVSEEHSLAGGINVLAAPGSGTFKEKWGGIVGQKSLTMFYDSDHPRLFCKDCKKSWFLTKGRQCPSCRVVCAKPPAEGAGIAGMKLVVRNLANSDTPPTSVKYLNWGEEGYDPSLKSGYDLRDWLGSAGDTIEDRMTVIPEMLSKVNVIPSDWLAGRSGATIKQGGTHLSLLPCSEWKVLANSCRKAMKWIDGLDRAMVVSLAVILSTETMGDQLWMRIVGPPSCGKSVLCEALSSNRKYVKPLSTFRGLFSGYKTEGGGSRDVSLAARLKNMTLVTKDGDTLLQSENRARILSEFRDFYDRVSRTDYKNDIQRDYEGINMTLLLYGTESLRELDESELGQRTLDCVIADYMDADTEDQIAYRKVCQSAESIAMMADGTPETRDTPKMTEMKRLTGGYVAYLRENAKEILSSVYVSDYFKRMCVSMGTFVAFMRARPSKRQQEVVQRELSFRLASQHVRLAICIAAVLNKQGIDDEVVARVKRVCMDTSRGRMMNLCDALYDYGHKGTTPRVLSTLTGQTEYEELQRLKFLHRLGAVERIQPPRTMSRTIRLYKLSDRLRSLYEIVVRPMKDTASEDVSEQEVLG